MTGRLAIPPVTPPDAAFDADDDLLVMRAQRGELAAFNQLVLRHQDAAYSLARRFLGSAEAAEDATQDAFLRAYNALDRFRGGRFRAWLMQIVANACRDELRRRQRRPTRSLDEARDDPGQPDLDPPDAGPTPEGAAEQDDLRRVLESALFQLPDEWRLIVVLSDVHGYAYDEIAASTGLPLGTVKSRLSRARGRLRDVLRAQGVLGAGGLPVDAPAATAERHPWEPDGPSTRLMGGR